MGVTKHLDFALEPLKPDRSIQPGQACVDPPVDPRARCSRQHQDRHQD
jgi:hypothetical protein